MKAVNRRFFILQGNNKTTYIFNTSTWKDISISSDFYKALSAKRKLQKYFLKFYLYFIGKFLKHLCYTKDEIEVHLRNVLDVNVASFNLGENCSLIISPTRDKIVINNHDGYYHKFGVKSSYNKIKNEVLIYGLLTNLVNFEVSNLHEVSDSTVDQCCSFKLIKNSEEKSYFSSAVNIPQILAEFFKKVKHISEINYRVYVDDLLSQYYLLFAGDIEQIVHFLGSRKDDVKITLGLVHKDFKPRNVIMCNKLRIFDFEETVQHGMPMEDLLNFHMDHAVRYSKTKNAHRLLFSKRMIAEYDEYLKLISCDIDYTLLIIAYLMERVIFWSREDEVHTASAFRNLLNYSIIDART